MARLKQIKRYPPRGRGHIAFANNGVLLHGSFPADCIRDCAAPGEVKESVEYWRQQLGLVGAILPVKSCAISYLREFGAWDDFGVVDLETIADRVLWTACCQIKETGEWLGMCH